MPDTEIALYLAVVENTHIYKDIEQGHSFTSGDPNWLCRYLGKTWLITWRSREKKMFLPHDNDTSNLRSQENKWNWTHYHVKNGGNNISDPWMLRASLHQTGNTIEMDLKIFFLDDYIHILLFHIRGFIR